MSGLDRKRFSCPEKLFIVEGEKKKILFDVWGEGFRGQENVIGNCSMKVSDVSPSLQGADEGCGLAIAHCKSAAFPWLGVVYGSSCPSGQADFLSVINGDRLSRTDSRPGLEVLSAASHPERDGKDK